jgi:predicted alpha/beta-fold hydrolase
MNTMNLFQPNPLFRNPHFQTLATLVWPYRGAKNFYWKKHYIPVTKDDTLVAYSNIQKESPESRADVFLVPGFEGNAQSRYVVRIMNHALQEGYNVHRMCLRGGGFSFFTTRLAYHPGLWQDVRLVMDRLRVGKKVFLVGISMGGHIVLKMAGDLGANMPGYVRGIAALSAPLDLDKTERLFSAKSIYHRHFLSLVKTYYYLRCRQWPKIYKGLCSTPPRSVREFDHHVTARLHGFSSVDECYRLWSCGPGLQNIAVPTLMIQAQDDPIVSYAQYEDYQNVFAGNRFLHTVLPQYGGHIGFIHSYRGPNAFWAQDYILSWFKTLGNRK